MAQKQDDDFPLPTADERFAGEAFEVAPLRFKGTKNLLSAEEEADNAKHAEAMAEVMKDDTDDAS
jgi:hypothetical protein